jgi:hypothetical protein
MSFANTWAGDFRVDSESVITEACLKPRKRTAVVSVSARPA